MYTIYTNNNAVAEFFKQHHELPCVVKWVSAPAIDVLIAARTNIRKGATLISDAQTGIHIPSKNPATAAHHVINPYLTVIITEMNDTIDFKSIKQIDNALSIYKKNAKTRFISHKDEALQHFQVNDLKHMLYTLQEKADINLAFL